MRSNLCRMLTASLPALALAASGCEAAEVDSDVAGQEDDDAQAARSPLVSVSPDPVQAGSIAITSPTATASNLRRGRDYFLSLEQGQADGGALTSIGGHVTADRNGAVSWAFQEDELYGRPDSRLVGGDGVLVVFDASQSDWKEVARTTFAITPNPGTVAVSPEAAAPGTARTLSGSGAAAGAALEAQWWETSNCQCWLFGCHSCTWTARSQSITADAGGAFTADVAPAVDASGSYCVHSISIVDSDAGSIVATGTYSYCP